MAVYDDRVTPKILRPLTDGIDDDAPAAAAHDLELARQTQALGRYASAERMSFAFFTPYDIQTTDIPAPFADITAENTWTSFTMGSNGASTYNYQLPWRISDPNDSVYVEPEITTDSHYLRYSFRIQKSTLITSTSTENFQAPTSQSPYHVNHGTYWQLADWAKGYAKRTHWRVNVKQPSLPSDRMILLTPQILAEQRGESPGLSVGGSHRVFLSSIALMDQRQDEEEI